MSVTGDGKVVRKIPVSMGKPSTPTSSGKMVIMEKLEHDDLRHPQDRPTRGYVVDVDDAQRLTWGGEFIHAAPWSVGDQGNINVSHGCTNVSAAARDWLMGITQVGDLVTIKGTEVTLTGQRLDRVERQLGRVRQGQRAAGAGRAGAEPVARAAPGRCRRGFPRPCRPCGG